MKTEDIRRAFLEFFRERGHTIVESSSLIPAGDPTLLFANSGMVQFKDCFLGTEKRAYTRATTCQKCLRISGKHNDLENVGRTARHQTFFEMLGNFSFGDYFKSDAIKFAWEFLTVTLALPKDRLWVTIYKEDDEADKLWSTLTDVLPGRILRCGKEDNFWAMGDTGPCGPCTEIHYYLGDNLTGQSEDEFRKGDGTYIEIWNLVFMQYNRDPQGNLAPLPKPSVDTGMGLERIAQVKSGVHSNYDADLLRGIIAFTEKLSGKSYLGRDYTPRDPEKDPQYATDVALRVIADHARAACFLIADGINPSSDGRGYVLRRLVRRACRHGRVLGFKQSFLYQVAGQVISSMGQAYPELVQHQDKIGKLIKAEEEKFLVTLDTGISILKKEVQAAKKEAHRIFPGDVAFSLHDTYGFPLDLTEDLVRSEGLTVDTDAFSRAMESQRERSRSARASEIELVLQRSVKPTPSKFVGYEFNEYESQVLGLFNSTGEIQSAKEGDEIALVSAETPFYAESGGQVGDTGSISSNNATLDVIDTQKVAGDTYVHICRVMDGSINKGEGVRLAIEASRRRKIRLNHSATHLVHLALREVLGDHVKQAGSRVSDTSLRFDFSHFEPIAATQLQEIEALANELILSNAQVQTEILPLAEAKKTGAVALFGEKYGELVRVVQIGPRSREFCGGTHAERSGDIGLVSIFSEGSVAAGTRRVEAYAGPGALRHVALQKERIHSLAQLLKSSDTEVMERVERLAERNRELEKNFSRLQQKLNSSKGGDLTEGVVTTSKGVKIISSLVDDVGPKELRELADDLKQRLGSGCIALGTVSDGKVVLLTAVTEDLLDRYHAGNLLSEISKVVGGRGGGRADLAQAGGGDPEKLPLALKRFQELI